MTRLLISAMTPDEAETALAAGADVIDLKNPLEGALGALSPDVIRACVTRVGGRAPTSATTGDHPATPEAALAAARPVARTGVDMVKIGLPPGLRRLETIAALGAEFLKRQSQKAPSFPLGKEELVPDLIREVGDDLGKKSEGKFSLNSKIPSDSYPSSPQPGLPIRFARKSDGGPLLSSLPKGKGGEGLLSGLVAVLFADWGYDPDLFGPLARAGFSGVVIDTADKSAGRLTDHLPLAALREAVARAHGAGLFIVLAGSLRRSDIPALAALRPDLLGFRGAACVGSGRTRALEEAAVRALVEDLRAPA